jgi:hypothetical protein
LTFTFDSKIIFLNEKYIVKVYFYICFSVQSKSESMSQTSETQVSAFSQTNTHFISSFESQYMNTLHKLSSNLFHSQLISIFALLMNLFQTAFLSFNKSFNFGLTTKVISKYFGFISRQWIFNEQKFEALIAVTLSTLLFLFFVFCFLVYLIKQAEIGKLSKRIACTLVFVVTHCFFVPFLGIFFTTFECNYSTLHLFVYPQVHCYLFPNTTTIAFATVGLILLLCISFGTQLL